MSPSLPVPGRRGLLAAAAGAALAGGALVACGTGGADGPPQPDLTAASAAPAPSPTPSAAPEPTPSPAVASAAEPAPPAPDFGTVLPASAPVGVSAPAIGLEVSGLVDLTIGPDGVLAAPVDYGQAGWHVAGPTPGQLGPSVIAGHVDGPDGPAVFYRLGELVAGDTVQVTRADGVVATFVVDRVGRFAKDAFPTAEVYGNTTSRAEIRLITCGGAFDRTTGHYVDNVVVFGHLV